MVWGVEEKLVILAIFDEYKNILKNLINYSDIKLLIILKIIGKKLYNIMIYFKDP